MIGRAIESVIAQTFTDWELLVVDDGSTDNTRQVVEGYNDPRIRYIYQQNAERSAARNNGIDNANGQYVCFIDSDDYFLPIHLQAFYEEINTDSITGMFFCQTVMDIDGKISNNIISNTPKDYNSIQEYLIVYPVRVAAVCIKKEALVNNKFDTAIRIGEDTELWVRIAKNYHISMTNAFTQAYVLHDEQSVSDKSAVPLLEHIKTLKYIFKTHNWDNKISVEIKNHVLAYSYFRLGQVSFSQGKYLQGVNNMLKSTTYKPFFRTKEKIYLSLTSIKGNKK